MPMTSTQQALYQRIENYAFDEAPAAVPFHTKLGKDNGWSLRYTARAITQYRRFAFLAVAANHPVAPSDTVDQVWHLHLLHSRSYWGRFCEQVLAAPLHHQPTEGGEQEREKFEQWYTRTLECYREYFGEAPPADIWPAAIA